MDCAVKNLEKTFDIKQKALVNKLHNMQWLKNKSHSSNPERLKTIYKHIDHDENNKLEGEDLTENIKTHSVEKSDKYPLIDTYKRYLPIDAISENNTNVWNKDTNLSNTFPNFNKLVNQKDKNEKDILMISKSIVTTKLDVQSYTDKMQRNQSVMPQNNENITQDAVHLNVSNFETKSNKTANLTYQDKNINTNEVLQTIQQPVFKQSVSKMRESVKKNASMFNCGIYKNKIFKKPEKKTSVSKDSDLILYESEKRNKSIVDEKHSQCHQKANNDLNSKRNTTFVMQYKNSTFAKPMQCKDILRNGECTSNGKNLSCNDYKFRNGHIDNVERRNVIKKKYISSNVFLKSNQRLRTEQLCTRKSEMNHIQSTTDTKSIIVSKKGTCNSEKNVNFVNAKTYLTENKECANLNFDIKRQKPILEQCYKEMKKIDEPNTDRQNVEINNITENEQTNAPKYLSNLLSNKCTIKTPTNVIHQHSLQFKDTQYMDDVKKLKSNPTTCNNNLSNTIQKNVTILNSQQSIQNMHCDIQQAITQAKDQTKQMPLLDLNDSKFYNQHFSVSNAMRPSQIPNTFNVASLYESDIQTSNDSNAISMLETAINYKKYKENSSIFYKYMPNIQQKSDTFSTFTDHSILLDQTKWNSSIQDSFHVDPYNIIRPTTIYNSDVFDPDDINNTRMNYLPHPIIYAPSSSTQARNPQLQYPLPVFYDSSCASYGRIIPNTINQSNNFNSIDSLHDQQLKYIPRVNNYIKINDLNNHTVQSRNIVDNVTMKFNHYEKCQDTSRMVYNPSRYVTPLPHSRSRQDMNFIVPVTNINQYNAYFWQNEKCNQNVVNYMQISKCPRSQTIQDLSCDDDESENIPPMISPKEFITNNVKFSNKFATQSV